MQPNLTTYRHKCIYIFSEKKIEKKKRRRIEKHKTFTKAIRRKREAEAESLQQRNRDLRRRVGRVQVLSIRPTHIDCVLYSVMYVRTKQTKMKGWQQNSFQFLWHAPLYIPRFSCTCHLRFHNPRAADQLGNVLVIYVYKLSNK